MDECVEKRMCDILRRNRMQLFVLCARVNNCDAFLIAHVDQQPFEYYPSAGCVEYKSEIMHLLVAVTHGDFSERK